MEQEACRLYERIPGRRAGVSDAHPYRFRDTFCVDTCSRGALTRTVSPDSLESPSMSSSRWKDDHPGHSPRPCRRTRLKRTGMHWTVPGSNAIIALRCSKLSGRFSGLLGTQVRTQGRMTHHFLVVHPRPGWIANKQVVWNQSSLTADDSFGSVSRFCVTTAAQF